MSNFLNPIDLHCHSTNSDGSYSVIQLLDLAKANGSKYLALTDHDTVDGILEAKTYAAQIGLNLISGVEISVTWEQNTLIHIIGLNVDENNLELKTNLELMRQQRFHRGERIAEKLAKIGIKDALDGALKYCNNPKALSRTHFLRFLVDNGYAKPGRAFAKYLAPGKPGHVATTWASLHDAVSWITNSGGVAVIAHPCRYKFTRTKLLKLISQFKEFGGLGIEVISSSHSLAEINEIAIIANSQGLLASVGSDFHNTDERFRTIKVGVNHPLPERCTPIYSLLGINEFIENGKNHES